MTVGAIVLFLNAALGLIAVSVYLLEDRKEGVAGVGVATVIDLVVAIGLIAGSDTFRAWGIGRAVLGGFLLGILAPLFVGTAISIVGGLAQIFFSAGILLLLYGDSRGPIRIGLGIAAVLISWGGVITFGLAQALLNGLDERAQPVAIEGVSSPGGRVEDSRIGVSIDLPRGWALVSGESPIARATQADIVVTHIRSGCYAALVVEQADQWPPTLDECLDVLLKVRQRDVPEMTDTGREDLAFGDGGARLMQTAWTEQDHKLRGFTAVCRIGEGCYVLSGWCADSSFSHAFPEYQSLAEAFVITGPKGPATGSGVNDLETRGSPRRQFRQSR
jgi:hypothetical protein